MSKLTANWLKSPSYTSEHNHTLRASVSVVMFTAAFASSTTFLSFFVLKHRHRFVASQIAKMVFVQGDSLPLGGRKYDIFECARDDDASHMENFLAAGQDLHKATKIAGKDWCVDMPWRWSAMATSNDN